MKRFLIIYAAISILGILLLLSRENLYVLAALIIGILLLGHRELWSLLRYRRLPVIDERVRNNLSSAMRLTGVFFFLASILLILLLRFNVFKGTPTGLIISGQLAVVGLVYVIGYYYYDRVLPGLGERATRWLKICLITAGLSLSTVALGIVLHNLISYLFNIEEGVFFVLGLAVAPAVFAVSLLFSLAIYIRGLFSPTGRVEIP